MYLKALASRSLLVFMCFSLVLSLGAVPAAVVAETGSDDGVVSTDTGQESATPVTGDGDPEPGVPPVDSSDGDNASESRVGTFAVEEAIVSTTVQMIDGLHVPMGLQATLTLAGGESETIPLSGGPLSVSVTFTTPVPYGGGHSIWITGNGYSVGQGITVGSETLHHGFSLERRYGTVDVTVNTSDGSDIPAGTVFEIRDVNDVVVRSGTLTSVLPSGSILPMTPASLEFGIYELTLSSDSPGTGRWVETMSMGIDVNNPWFTEYAFTANVEILQVMSTGSFTVQMIDGGAIPFGLEWTLFPSGQWDPIASGPVTGGTIVFEHDIPVQVPAGAYQLWITGNGYSTGQVINVQSDTFSHGFSLERIQGNLTVTVTTSDGTDVPAGTAWELLDANDVVVQHGVLTSPLPSGGTLPLSNPIEFGVYTLNIGPGSDNQGIDSLPRELLPFTTTVTMTNSWVSDYAITAALEWAQSDLTFTVSMSDNGPLPIGLEWSLVQSGSWDPLASGPVTAGELSFSGDIADPVPFGAYQLWITGNGYSSGQVLNVDSFTTHHDVVLDRLEGTLTVTVTTSDGTDVPAGTAWELLDANNGVVQSGTTASAIPSGGTLPLSNPIEFGLYTLNIGPGGDTLVPLALTSLPRQLLPFSTMVNITNPWVSDYAITAELQWAQSDLTFTVSMSDNGPLPNGLEWSLVQSSSWDPLASGPVTAGEMIYLGDIADPVPFGAYQLWITGNGYSSGQVLNITSFETHHDFVLDRLEAEVTAILETSDGAEIPAGTTWSIVDSAGNPVENGVLTEAMESGSALPLTANPYEFDVYTLVIDAEGYHPVSMELSVTNPWVTEVTFIVILTSDALPEPSPSPSPEPSPSPSPSPSPATPDASETPAAPITKLPETGAGEGNNRMMVMLVLVSGSVLAAAVGGLLRERSRSM